VNSYKYQNTSRLILLLAVIFIKPDSFLFGGEKSTEKGLAAKYISDEGIEKDPDVILFTDFELEKWHKDWSGGRRPFVW
jgi:hypothetical protein